MSSDGRWALAAGHPLAVDEGAAILAAGGNAADAAVAVAFVQGVVDPAKCGIGGWGVATWWDGRRVEATSIDFPGRAGSRVRPDMWLADLVEPAYHGYLPRLSNAVNDVGYRSIAVPGWVAGLAALFERGSGRFTWGDLIAPAIRFARDGVPIYSGVLGAGPPEWDWPGAVPFDERLAVTRMSAATYLPGGRFFRIGEPLVQPVLATTLETLAERGPDAFYRGPIAERIAADLAAHGADVTADDLAGYRPTVGPPVAGPFGDLRVHSAPPPESGVSLIRALGLLDGRLDAPAGPLDPANAELIADSIGTAAEDRARYLADPAFVDVPVERLLGTSLVPGDTTSVVVVDGEGNAVAMNHSLASHAGSGVMSEGLGFLYNNCMAGFDVEPGKANSIAPGKARWSAAAPAVVTAADGVRLLITGPGGSRAIGAVIQGAIDVLVFGMSPLEAVSAPRLDAHDGIIDLEARVPASTERALVARGRRVNRTYESGFAALYAVTRDPSGRLEAADDPRRTGGAIVGRAVSR